MPLPFAVAAAGQAALWGGRALIGAFTGAATKKVAGSVAQRVTTGIGSVAKKAIKNPVKTTVKTGALAGGAYATDKAIDGVNWINEKLDGLSNSFNKIADKGSELIKSATGLDVDLGELASNHGSTILAVAGASMLTSMLTGSGFMNTALVIGALTAGYKYLTGSDEGPKPNTAPALAPTG